MNRLTFFLLLWKHFQRLTLLTSLSWLIACESKSMPNEDADTVKLKQMASEAVRQHKPQASAKLEVISLEAVEWPDESLGCPQPGMMYIQMITPGYRAVVTTGELNYAVHISGERAFVCEQTSSTSAADLPSSD